MKITENEFKSPYDLRELLWYIIPGATFLLSIFLYEFWLAGEIRQVDVYFATDMIKVGETMKNDTSKIFSEMRAEPSWGKADTVIIKNSIKILKKELFEELHTPIFTALRLTYESEKTSNNNWIISSVYLLVLLSICYILGHITYMFGTFIFERGLIMKGYGYPYINLLGLDEIASAPSPLVEVRANQAFYKAVYFWTVAIFITLYILYWLVGYNDYYLFKVIEIIAISLFLIPCRFKFILDNIIEWEKENLANYRKQKREILKTWRIVRCKCGLRRFIFKLWHSRTVGPVCSGYIYWPLCSFLLVWFMHLINFNRCDWVKLTHHTAWGSSSLSLFLEQWVCFILVFILSENIIRAVLTTRKNIFSKIIRMRLLTIDEELRRTKFPINTVYDIEKTICQIFFIKIGNIFGNESDKFFRNYFHTPDRFDDNFIELYRKSFIKVYGNKYTDLSRHNYWLSKFYIVEQSNNLSNQMTFWENTYRFAKSLSASFLLASIYCSFSFMYHFGKLFGFLNEPSAHPEFIAEYLKPIYQAIDILFLIPIGLFIVTSLTVLYYRYVYDNRYNRMILRGFVSLVAAKEINRSKPSHRS